MKRNLGIAFVLVAAMTFSTSGCRTGNGLFSNATCASGNCGCADGSCNVDNGPTTSYSLPQNVYSNPGGSGTTQNFASPTPQSFGGSGSR